MVLQEKVSRLDSRLKELSSGGIALAFSGGADSAFLLFLLADLRKKQDFPFAALTFHSPFQPDFELEEAKALTRQAEAEHLILSGDPLALPEVAENPPDRCYYCKKYIFSRFREEALRRGMAVLADGTNFDDLSSYRPGLRALTELESVSPLAEAELTKTEIRELAARRGWAFASKPAAPCLATRFPYGTQLTPGRLRLAGAGEGILREFLPEGTAFRLRLHDDLARIEIPPAQFPLLMEKREALLAALKPLGIRYVTLDLEGFRSGSMDSGLR